MKKYYLKLKKFIDDNNIKVEHMVFTKSCHSVIKAANVVKSKPEDFVKNICLLTKDEQVIIAIVKGEDKVSKKLIAKAINIDLPRIATPDEILEKTGFPCGGVPSFGYQAIFLIDSRVMEKDIVYSGGGSENSLVKISTEELLKINQGKIADIRK